MGRKLSLKTKIGYGAAALADASGYTFVSTYFLFFLTTIAGVNPAVAGTISAIGGLWDALMGPLVGFVSDNFQSKYGRRVPFIFFTAFPLAITTCLMFTQVDMSDSGRLVYYGIMTLIFWGSFSTFFIPFMALGAELTTDYHERTVLRSYAYVFNTFGMAVGMAFPTVIVDAIINRGSSAAFAWQMVGVIVSVSILLSMLTACGILKEKNTNFTKQTGRMPLNPVKFVRAMASGYIEVLKLKPLRIIIFASVLFLIAYTVNAASRIYFLSYNCNFSGAQIAIIMFILTIIGVVFAPVVLKCSKIYDKRKVLIFGLIITLILVVAMRIISTETFVGVIIYCLVFCIGNTCYWQLAPAIIYDVCELDELVNNKRREGTIVSLQSIAEAASAAVSMQVLGLILNFSGFDGEAAVQTDRAIFWLENSFSIVPVIFIVLSMIMVIKYPINKSTFDEILRQIEVKKEGGEPDLSKLKKIF